MNQEIVTPEAFLQHWLGHRRLTRQVIEAFPEDKLFTFAAAENMRPFGEMCSEILLMTEMQLDGLLTGKYQAPDWSSAPKTRAGLVAACDAQTERLRNELPKVDTAVYAQHPEHPWGKKSNWEFTIYNIDNEIHHRGQGYVYLRALGLEPPAFYAR